MEKAKLSPVFDCYKDDAWIDKATSRRNGCTDTMKDFYKKIIEEYGEDSNPAWFTDYEMKLHTDWQYVTNTVIKLIHNILEYVEFYHESLYGEEEKDAEAPFDLYKDSIYVYGLVKEQGTEKVLKDFLGRVADEYGVEAEPTLFASSLIKCCNSLIEACPDEKMDWNGVNRIIECVFDYIENYFNDEDEEIDDEEDYTVEEDEWTNNEDCMNYNHNCNCSVCNSAIPSDNIQTVTFTTKSGGTLSCCTDEDIVSIKVESSNGKISIFNL